MKPIIVDMEEMSDSTEVYGTRPSPVFAVVIYTLVAILVVTGIWMCLFQMDIVTHADGMIRYSDYTATITNISAGKIVKTNLEDGEYVSKGEILFSVEADSINQQKDSCQSELNAVESRLEILNAYLSALDGDTKALNDFQENSYYSEFITRKSVVDINCATISKNSETQKSQYDNSINTINNSIQIAQNDQEKLNQMLTDIRNRTNDFSTDDVYYYSMVQNYITNFNLTSESYDRQIKQLQSAKDSGNTSVDYDEQIATCNTEKSQALTKLETDMVVTIEQSISTVSTNLNSLNSSLSETQNNLNNLSDGSSELGRKQIIDTEKSAVYTEIETNKNKEVEYKSSLETLETNLQNCTVTAQCSGYLNLTEECSAGDYVSAGETFGSIIPADGSLYIVQLYIDNQDIGKIRKGQNIRYEIAAYPSSEYGTIEGTVTKISKDIKVNKDNGKGYYAVEATIQGTDGAELIQGMAVEAKLITEKKSIMKILLEKIDLLD